MTINWTPDINNVNEPADSRPAAYNAPEIRKIKDVVRTLTIQGGPNVPVRQTVLSGPVGSSGLPSFIAAGTGLACNLNSIVTLAFANGFNTSGANDYIERITSDQASYWSGLAPFNKTYLSFDRTIPGTVVASKTLAPPQYGPVYDQTKQALLHFEGTAGATTFLDDYGNAWTAQGGAKLQTNWKVFGTTALGGGGANNALNGTNDFIQTTQIKTVGNGGWSLRCRVRFTALPATSTAAGIASLVNASGFGVILQAINSAGVTRFTFQVSSTGSTADVANNVTGATTIAINVDYAVELTFDSVANVYRLYVGGIQEASTASTLRACAVTKLIVGGPTVQVGSVGTTGYIDEFEFLPYCDHPNGTTYTVPTAASSVSAAGYSSDWFDTTGYNMYYVSGPSTSAGTNPTLTQVNRLYAGEAITSGAAVTSAYGYAYAGFIERLITTNPTAATTFSTSHQIGTTYGLSVDYRLINITSEYGYRPGDKVDIMYGSPGANGEGALTSFDSITAYLQFAGTTLPRVPNRVTGALQTITSANWYVVMTAYRYR